MPAAVKKNTLTRSQTAVNSGGGKTITESPSSIATVLLSGGIDSTACTHFMLEQGLTIRAIFVDYGQLAAKQERKAARKIAKFLKVPLQELRATSLFRPRAGELLGRNAFLIMAAMFLTRLHSGIIGIGIHAGTSYIDCSDEFVSRMEQLLTLHTDGSVRLVAPFLHWKKADVLAYFRASGLPLDLTYSCERGSQRPCKRCASCRDRKALGVG